MPGNAVVITDANDPGRQVELDSDGVLPVRVNVGRPNATLHRYGAAGTTYFLNVNDAVVPVLGSGLDLSKYGYAAIGTILSGDAVSWDIVPLYGDTVLPNYVSGDAISIVGDQGKTLTVAGCSDFYVMCRNSAGTNPGIKVYVAGYNL